MRLNRRQKDAILEILRGIMEAVPDDRSCFTCALFGGQGWCNRWRESVPSNAQPLGCEEWQDDDVPF